MMASLFAVFALAVAAAWAGHERAAKVLIFLGAILSIAMLLYHATSPLRTVL